MSYVMFPWCLYKFGPFVRAQKLTKARVVPANLYDDHIASRGLSNIHVRQ
jgi:hypothetical protein